MALFLFSLENVFLLLLASLSQAPPLLVAAPDFSCSDNSRSASCKAYIAYFARNPGYMDVGNIADLFGVSPMSIIRASNLVSEDTLLLPDQLLLIPLHCECTNTGYFVNVTYEIKKGDSFYFLSAVVFENLTDWRIAEETNPQLNPNLLQIGMKVTIPLPCKCPTESHSDEGIDHLITYVWQPSDQVLTVANKFGAMPSDIYSVNNQQSFDGAVGRPVLIPVSELPALSQPSNRPGKKSSSSICKTKLIVIIVFSVGGAISILLLTVFLIHVRRYRKRGHAKVSESNRPNVISLQHDFSYVNILGCRGSSMETIESVQQKDFVKEEKSEKLLPDVSDYLSKPIMYESRDIMEATLDLNEKFRVGRSVFKAMIDGKPLVVKRIKDEATEELRILQKVNHANLVKLIGLSSEKDGRNRFFVYEYAENGSLDKWLYSSISVHFLTWSQRLQIALDVANGLQYLHEHTQPSIVHRNIKLSNILLDARLKAKLSNFSMAKSSNLPASLKADIFAFGVVLLELLSGKKAVGTKEYAELAMLREEVRVILGVEEEKRLEKLRDWMDPNLEGFYPVEEALSLANLARACTVEEPHARPSMGEIVFSLCVLAQSTTEMAGGCWTSQLEGEDVVQVINPVVAR